jgi:hypothetical protein
MADAASIKIVKTVPFNGGTQRWSNRYHFDGVLPPDSATWTVFADAIKDLEKVMYPTFISIVEAVGYGPGSDVPVFSKSYSQAGTGSYSGHLQAAEVAALVKYTTAKRSTKNHPVYLFNYYHGVYMDGSAALGTVDATEASFLEAYADAWEAGISDGSHTHHRTGPDGTVAIEGTVETYLTHRDFR